MLSFIFQLYSRKWFWLTILDAVYESLVVFFVALWVRFSHVGYLNQVVVFVCRSKKKTVLICFLLKVYNGTAADLRMVGMTLHQSSVVVANLYLALVTAQWVS